MRRILLLGFALFIISTALGQTKADSTKQLLTLADKNTFSNPDSAIVYAKQALNTASSMQDTALIAWAYNNLGSSYWVKGDYVASLDYFQKLVGIGELKRDASLLAKAYGNIAVISIDLEDLEPAYKNSIKAYTTSEALKDTNGMAINANNIGVIYEKKKQYDSALYYYNTAYKLWTSIGDKEWSSLPQSNISKIYAEQKDVNNALKHGVLAMQLAEKENVAKNKGHAYISLAKAFMLKGDTKTAITYAQKALDISAPKGIIEIMRDAHEVLYDAYNKQNKTVSAFAQLKAYTTLKDSMVNTTKLKQINHLQTRVRFEEKNKQIEAQEKQIIISESARQRNLMLLVGACILLLAIIIVAYQIHRKQKLKIKTKNQQIQMEQQELQLAELSLKNEQLVNKELKTELDFRKQELLSYTLITTQKNQLLQELNEQIDTFADGNDPKEIRKVKSTINAAMSNKENWEEFKVRFEQVHVTFFDTLKALYPQLSPNDLRLCAFIKLSLSSKQISSLLNIAPSSVDISKYRLKKKFDLEKDEQLYDFISRIHNL